ncbi:FtsX-like permease family protein, partial [Streptomyces violascens]|uniref:FtsX-like permease family protein n=1 Tax=Streptomyces violascens TaxID=67381 RepID=UPI0036822D1B
MPVLVVGNVVSGAAVSGFRHIGVLKSLGFTPNQVVAVYLVMVCVPAAVGAAIGTALGGVRAAAAAPGLPGREPRPGERHRVGQLVGVRGRRARHARGRR